VSPLRLCLLHLPPRIDGPYSFYNALAIRIVEVVQVDGGIDVTRDHLDAVPNLQIRSVFPRQTPMLVTQHTVCVPQRLALSQPTVRREALQPRIDGDLLGALLANDRGEDGEAVLVLRPHRISIIRIHEQETARLDLRHPLHGGAELSRPRAACGHDVDLEPFFSERLSGIDEDLHTLETRFLPLVEPVEML
jgi:hypothetical protein